MINFETYGYQEGINSKVMEFSDLDTQQDEHVQPPGRWCSSPALATE
jgi:hypothetical protein